MQKFTLRVVSYTFIISFIYAIIRYNIFKGVPWENLPLYVSNKAFSLASLIIILFVFSLTPLKNMGRKIPEHWMEARKGLGIIGLILAFIHSGISFFILNPAYFGKLFQENNTMTLFGEICMLSGVIYFTFLLAYHVNFQALLREGNQVLKIFTTKGFILFGMLMSGCHVFFLGVKGWHIIEKWPGGLPPISLISFLVFFIGFTINLLGRK